MSDDDTEGVVDDMISAVSLYKATRDNVTDIAQMAIKMWSDNTLEGLAEEFKAIVEGDESVIFMISIKDQTIGFAQCQLRHDYVEGTDSSPVGYLEGIFVEQEYRNKGYAKELLQKCEEWAKKKGCVEFASDCELNNKASLTFHLRMGFAEANRVICFTKKL